MEKTGDREREAQWLVEAARGASEAGADEESWALAERGLQLPLTATQEGRLRTWAAVSSALGEEAPSVTLGHADRALDLLPVDDELMPMALGAAAYGALRAGDGGTIMRVASLWTATPRAPRGRLAAIGMGALVAALSRFGLAEQAEAILAASRGIEQDPVGARWYHVSLSMRANNTGAMGRSRAWAIRAVHQAIQAGDDLARVGARIFELIFGLFCRSSRLLEALEAATSDTDENLFAQYVAVNLAVARGRADPRALGAMERFASSDDLSFAEFARVAWAALLWEADPDRVEAVLDRAPFYTPDQQSTERALRARVALRRGAPERALEIAAEAAVLAERVVNAWTFEIIGLTRTAALHALGRTAEARASMHAAITRLAVTLEGADDFMLAVVDEGGLPVIELRALATELGVPFPPLADLARPGRITAQLDPKDADSTAREQDG